MSVPCPVSTVDVGIAEFGMLGKIGLERGRCRGPAQHPQTHRRRARGVPIHMIFNRVLSRASTLAEALEIIHSSPTSSSSIITVITAEAAVQVEIAGETKRERRADGRGFLIHTNHFLHPDLLDGALELRPDSTSQERGRHLEQVVARFEADRAATGEAEPAVEPHRARRPVTPRTLKPKTLKAGRRPMRL